MIIQMQWNEHLALVLGLTVLITAITALKRKHGDLVYGLWYLYFFSFALLLMLTTSVHYASVFFAGDFGSTAKSLSEAIVNYAIDVKSEIVIVLGIIWLGIIPQVFAYLVGGISGSAATPRFVSSITKLAIWSVIKFVAVYAGLMLARAVFLLAFFGTHTSGISYYYVAESVLSISLSFAAMLIYLKALRLEDYLSNNKPSLFHSINRYFTRYRLDRPEDPHTRRFP